MKSPCIKNTVFLDPVTEAELLSIVIACKSKHSKDCHDMSMVRLQKLINVIMTPLLHICNLSFAYGVFPNKMKTAKVFPVFKKGNRLDMQNYRPISILPQFSKLLEKLFAARINSFLSVNEVITNSQYGFMKMFQLTMQSLS